MRNTPKCMPQHKLVFANKMLTHIMYAQIYVKPPQKFLQHRITNSHFTGSVETEEITRKIKEIVLEFFEHLYTHVLVNQNTKFCFLLN